MSTLIDFFKELGKRRNATALIGESGSGKTTLAVEIIDAYPPERGMVTIVDTMYENDLRKYAEISFDQFLRQNSGKYRVTTKEWQTFFDHANTVYAEKSTKKGLIYVDDADLMAAHEHKPISHLAGGVRHKKLDMIFSFHHLWRAPAYIVDNCQLMILKKTGESIDKGDINRFKHGKRIVEAFERVDAHPDKHYTEVIKLYGI